MAEKLTEKENEDISNFLRDAQNKMAGVLIMQARAYGMKENTIHTEVYAKDEEGEGKSKYLITSTVRPLTKKLQDEISKKK